MQIVVCVPPHREGWRVGPAHDHRTGFAEVGHDGAVFLGDVLGEGDHAVAGGLAPLVDVGLDADRHAMQQTQGVVPGERRIGGFGVGDGLWLQVDHHGVELGVDLCHPVQAGLDHLAARDHALANAARHVDGVPFPEFSRQVLHG